MKIYILSAYFYDQFDGCKQIHSTVERAFDSKAAAEKYVAAGGKFEVAYAKFSHYSIGEVEFETATSVTIDPDKINWNGGHDAVKRRLTIEDMKIDYGFEQGGQRCLWDGIPSKDRIPMGLCCTCPKCSPTC